jgi:hypothetical protein
MKASGSDREDQNNQLDTEAGNWEKKQILLNYKKNKKTVPEFS